MVVKSKILHRILEITNKSLAINPLLDETVAAINSFTGCKAIGIRVLDRQGNIPYESYVGFSKSFYGLENPLSIKSDQCMCINVIKGTTNAKLPYYTKGGSFYANSTTSLLATASERDKGKTRNICNEYGYESVALIPIRLGDRILGLIHIADPRMNQVPLNAVEVMEEIGLELGTAIRRVRAEEKLRETDARYRTLLHLESEVGESIIMLQDTEQGEAIQTFVSEQWPRITGYSKEELLGMSFLNLVGTEDRAGCIDRHRRKMNGEALPGLYEMSIIRKDGKEVSIELTSARSTFEKTKANVAFIRDITERKKADETIRESEEKYRTLFESMIEGFAYCQITVDENNQPIDFIYLNVNDAFEKITGLRRKDVIGIKVSQVIPRTLESHPELLSIYGKVALTGEPTSFDIQFKPLSMWLSISVNSPKRGYFVATFVDITERKIIENKLRHSEAQFRLFSQKIIKAQEDERARIARELHDQLAQELVVLRREALSLIEKLKGPASHNEGTGIISLVDNISDKVRKMSVELRPKMLDELGLIRALQWYLQDFEHRAGVHCLFNYGCGDIQEDTVNREVATAAYRIFQEAMLNIRKHSKADSVIVDIYGQNGKLIIVVTDNGIGFDNHNLKDRSSLGILGMKERASIVGGSMQIKGNKGHGTKITISLPTEELVKSQENIK